jgi:hypothetical protein
VWPRLVDAFIDQVLENRDLFLLHQRNPRAIEAIAGDERHRAANEDMEDRFRRFLASPAIPLADRVRMACSIGAVFAALMGATEVFGDVDTDEVAGYLREAVHDLFPARR